MKSKLLGFFKLLIVGLFVGLTISAFQTIAKTFIQTSYLLLNNASLPSIILCVFVLLVLFALVYINKRNPGYYGSGIPQIEAYYDGNFQISPVKMFLLITINSLFAFFVGLPLGSEGPSISISTCIGMFFNNLFKSDDIDVDASAGSAGFACAFSNPIAGMCHLIEENKKIISVPLILKALLIILPAYFINSLLIKDKLLPYFEISSLPPMYYIFILLLIPMVLFFGKLYSFSVLKIKDLSKGNKIMLYITPLMVVLFLFIRKYFPIIGGNGTDILKLDIADFAIIVLFLFLLFRIITTALSVSAYTSGGIVLPMLAIGALVGLLTVKTIGIFDPNILQYSSTFMICGMFAFFAVLTKCPLTAIALGISCAPFNLIALPLTIVVLLSSLISNLLSFNSIYFELEQRLTNKNNKLHYIH